MRVFITFALFAFAIVSTGCSAFGGKKLTCLIHEKIVAVGADAAVKNLECKNAFAVKVDVDRWVSTLGLCKTQTGPIADTLCPSVVNFLVEKMATGIPEEWGCTATNAKALFKDGLTKACVKIPVSTPVSAD